MLSEVVDRNKSGKEQSGSFTYTPTAAIKRIEDSSEQLLLIDLDLTLVLGPTTEAFLDSARPSSYAYAIVAVTEKIRPWRLLPGREKNRDWIRVLMVVLFMPWSYFRWRSVAASWTQENVNQLLVDAVQNHEGRVIVITRGFTAIVNPVVKALRLAGEEKVLTIACKVFRWRGLRQFSKTEHVERSSTLIEVENSMVVSDSMQDYELFAACETPILTEWQGAYWIEPNQNAYIPLRYVQLTKTPFKKFVQVSWLKDDYILCC